ncbi:hypothetical protein GPL15_12830 [Clostridium sp. MCC353]|uniref:transglutaminase domain-containing protein n=1 Tax=Clostridium sp. MCC353 TaxID=2592646 RepID=UPI001C026186|nr:transglutaminase domain-containing protein [Clostridium sp. MCC353]MBT9777387.1 hypothetical protein [Clostridium sp. MCC353]
MKKRRLLIAALSGIMALMPITAYAAEGWVQDERGWKYQLEDGSWRTDGWVGDDDGTCYYLDSEGYMLTNGYTPDGTWIGADGVWVKESMRAEYEARNAAFASVTAPDLSSKDVSQYPLLGKIPYSLSIDGSPVLFTNNLEYAQSNIFKSNREIRMRDANVLLYLAGLYNNELTEYEQAVVEKVMEFLNSFDWQNATDYEKAEQAVRFIAERSHYDIIDDDALLYNSSYSCLVKGVSACDGFAQSFHLLTRAVGVRSFYVSTLNHAWNYIKTNDVYFVIDTSDLVQSYHYYDDNDVTFNSELTKYLTTLADDADQNIWSLNGTSLQFDPNILSEPLF